MRMSSPRMLARPNSLEHRARELLNLAQMSDRCARLPHLGEAERRRWQREARHAMEAVSDLLPELAAAGGTAAEVITLAARTVVEMGLDEPCPVS